MKYFSIFLALLFLGNSLHSQPITLKTIGQSPGGSAFHVNYDESNNLLYAGNGTSIWLYDAANPEDLKLIAKRGLKGLVQHTSRINNVLFVAAARDGLWALDINTKTLDVIAHYPLEDVFSAYGLFIDNDTIYLANNRKVEILTFDEEIGFVYHTSFGVNNSVCIAKRGEYIAVGSRGPFLNGRVNVFHVSNLNNPISTWISNHLVNIYNIRFADLRDDIIYVCAGSSNGGLTGRFIALQLNNNKLELIDEFTMQGVLGIAQCNIINMDSRNDTIFLATTACLEYVPMPETSVAILDASNLPDGSLKHIGHIQPGLWHFDVALLGDNKSYLAIASEWYGIWISGLSDLSNPYDTVGIFPTGGWGKRSYVFGDTLWGCMEGYGLAAYKIDSLLHINGHVENPEIFHVFEQFVNDFTFVDDTLIFLSKWNNKYEVYNIAPWLKGGEPQHLGHFSGTGSFFAQSIATVETNVGTRVICGHSSGNIEFIDPYDIPYWNGISSTNVGIDIREIIVCNDTVWTGAKINNTNAIAAYKAENDSLKLLFYAQTPGVANKIAKDGNMIAAACEYNGVSYYYYDNNGIYFLNNVSENLNAVDCYLKNNYLYVADKLEGLKIYDINNQYNEELVATCIGSGGFYNQFGSSAIKVANDGRIFLTDYNGGIYIIEAFDKSLNSFNNPVFKNNNKRFTIYPNPTKSGFSIDESVSEVYIYDITGKKIAKENKSPYGSFLKSGIYIVKSDGFAPQKLIIVD